MAGGRGNKKIREYNIQKIWKAAIYARRSFDDNEDVESNTIINQRNIVKEYIEKDKNIRYVDEYIDDGYTGTNFNRPDFQRLLKDIQDNKIDTIIVKDLSRLGRNGREMGRYIEEVFPSYGTRLIAINDDVDSIYKPESVTDLIFSIKNLINESYARDISKKVTTAYLSMAKQGLYVAGIPPYGYKIDPEKKHHLVIDEEESLIVKKIFDLAGEGHGTIYISKHLNNSNILCRKELLRRKKNKLPCDDSIESKYLWSTSSIERMLSNEVYIGNLVQLKTMKKSMESKREVPRPEKDWVRVDNTHDAIVSKELFLTIQSNSKINNVKKEKKNINYSIFNGILKCADCNRAMMKQEDHRGNRNISNYYCSTSLRTKNTCSKHKIKTSELEKMVLSSIQLQVKLVIELERSLKKLNIFNDKEKLEYEKNNEIKIVELKITRLKDNKKTLYENWKFGLIEKADYLIQVDKINKEVSALEDEIELCNSKYLEKIKKIKKNDYWINHFKRNKKNTHLTKEILNELIDTIYVYENGNIKIIFKYQEEYNAIVNYVGTEGVEQLCQNGMLEYI